VDVRGRGGGGGGAAAAAEATFGGSTWKVTHAFSDQMHGFREASFGRVHFFV